jgi:hypothetical protein
MDGWMDGWMDAHAMQPDNRIDKQVAGEDGINIKE